MICIVLLCFEANGFCNLVVMDEGLVITLDLCLAVTHFESWLLFLLFDRSSANFPGSLQTTL